MSAPATSHSTRSLEQWDRLQRLLATNDTEIEITGGSLDVPTLVAAARHNSTLRLSESALPRIEESAAYFKRCLAEGHSVYGVNTGFGGSADTRTDKTDELQDSLIGFLNCGVIDVGGGGGDATAPVSATTIPEAWVRASMLVRANSLARGHSGVRVAIIGGLVNFLNCDIVPLIPLRGSISASGDLIPLSYIAGALQGKKGISVWSDTSSKLRGSDRGHITPPTPASSTQATEFGIIEMSSSSDAPSPAVTAWTTPPRGESMVTCEKHPRQLIAAHDALEEYALTALKLEPKEGLSLVNGTAVSAGTGALAIHDAQGIALLSQVLTAMSVEALTGNAESFDPFLGEVRPHSGQIEAAQNIRCFLKGSKLAKKSESEGFKDQGGLRQDRYSLRTTPQWIGPQLENLSLAHEQVEIECNSTTDNPILDSDSKRVLHGGNFQALAITSAMEKTRQSLQQLGRMLFIQCSELVNPVLSNGLPPNLEAGEPSQGFLCKGIDISIASLQSELGYLANPITAHIQTAEMGNQSLNSMAFVSARYTHTAIDVISQLAAAHLFAVCQALDLRCIQRRFLETLQPRMEFITRDALANHVDEDIQHDLHQRLWQKFQAEFARTTSQDSTDRFDHIFQALQPEILCTAGLKNTASLFDSLAHWTAISSKVASQQAKDCFINYILKPYPGDYLGAASMRIWSFVRSKLRVLFHVGKGGFLNEFHENEHASVGEMVTRIYAAIREGELVGAVMECLRDAQASGEGTS